MISWPVAVHAQHWSDKVPEKSEPYTLYDYQKAFNDFWDPYNVTNGYYTDASGERQKAAGWKLFKRWEWYWQSRVDPRTGEFPEANRIDIYQAEKDRFPLPGSTRDANGNWTSLGPNTSPGGYAGLGRINTIGFSSNANTYYAGSPSGGLWKTTDDGATWTVLSDDLDALGVSDIIVLPGANSASDTLFIGTGDRDGGSMSGLNGGQAADNNGIGILRSYDGGMTWNTTGLTFAASEGNRVSRMLLDPNDSQVMLASVIGKFINVGNVYRSTDRGATFQTVSNERFIDMEYKPGSSDTVYGSTMDGEIHRSVDGGLTWAKVWDDNGNGRIELAVTPDAPQRIYAIEVNSANRGLWAIWRSDNDGTAWAKYYDGTVTDQNLLGYPCDASDNKGQGEYDLCIAADPTDANKVYIGGINLWRSINGGLSWTISSHWLDSGCGGTVTPVHADQHYLGFQPGTNHLFNGNDGGVYRTEDEGVSWIWKGDGMTISQIYRIGLSPSTEGTYISGLQDNGTKSAGGGTWTDRVGGDGMECIVDYTSNSIQYSSGPSGDIYRTTNNWGSNTQITKSDTLKGGWVTPYALDPATNTTLFVGSSDLWKSTNSGASFTKIGNFAVGTRPGKLLSLAVCPTNSDYIYVADDDTLRKTEDGGTSWSIINGTLPVASSSITYVSVHDSMPDTAWVSFGQYNNHGVYQTFDGGASWTNISAGLPPVPVMCVIQNRRDTAIHLYAATDIGVYVKIGEANWSRFSDGLPNVVVTELEIFYDPQLRAGDKLRAGTYGRGLWESDTYSATDAPVPEFEADQQYPNTGETVTFTDLSENVPSSWTWSITPSAGVAFVNGTSASSVNPQVQFAGEGEYDVKLVVENSAGSNDLTKAAYITVSNLPSGYCAANSNNGYGAITEVNYVSIDNTSGIDAGGYGDYTLVSTTVEKGSGNDLFVKINVSDVDIEAAAWIDWNRDGDFDDLQENVACGSTDALGEATFSVTAPLWAEEGKTKLRVRTKLLGTDCGEPCGTTNNGEVEDYSVIVISGTPTDAPTADFTTDNTTPPLYETVHLLDQSTQFPDSWTWSITPDDFQYVNGTSASSQVPQVSFNTIGKFTVQLTAGNSLGSDTEIKTDYIDVQAQPAYCAAGSTSGVIGIDRVQFNTIDNNGTGLSAPPHYADYTATHETTVETGSSHTLTLTAWNPQGNNNDFFAWIDWNGDGDFEDDGEDVGCAVDVTSPHSFTIDVPGDATINNTTRMRVRIAFSATCATGAPCGNTTYGEVEDYGVEILAGDFTWTGSSSSNWSDAANWNPGIVPSFTANVTIPPTANDPVVTGTAETRDLTLQSDAALDVAPGGELTVHGDLDVAAAGPNRAAATFTVQSDAGGNGSVIVKGSVTGEATVQRYMAAYTSGADGWHLIGSPVTGNIDINSSTWDPGASDDFYGWSESDNEWKNHKQGNPSEIVPTHGYLVAYAADKTGTFTGSLANADAAVSGLSVVNGGWHLRGNPFPSAITWNAPSADWNLANIGGIAKVWDEAAANYADISAGSPIPSTNGFFVQATVDGASGFDIPASARVHSTVNNYKGGDAGNFDRTLVLHISNDVNTFYDVARIGLRDDATEEWDMAFDARKIFGRSAAPQLWTLLAGEDYSWNNLPPPPDQYSLPLHFKAGVTAGYTLRATGMNSFYDSEVIYLEDLFTGQTISLVEQPVYAFAATKGDETGRFVLHFYGPTDIGEPAGEKHVSIYAAGQDVYIRFAELPEEAAELAIYNTYGQAVYQERLQGNLLERIRLQENPGVYIVRVSSAQGMVTGKVFIR